MKVEVLVSTMNQKDLSIVNDMNLQTDAIIINQTDNLGFIEKRYKNSSIRMFSFKERGVGLSRNNALMRASADICLMADDDMRYKDGYKDMVIRAFKKRPKADIIMFNVPIYKKDDTVIEKVKGNGRVKLYNALRYGTVNIAFKREAIFKKNISFSLLFGGGAKYSAGEDTLFIVESLKKGLKIYSCKDTIAEINEGESTWFRGYNNKFFFDRGALFQAIGGTLFSFVLIFQYLIRKRRLYHKEISLLEALKEMLNGRKNFLNKKNKMSE